MSTSTNGVRYNSATAARVANARSQLERQQSMSPTVPKLPSEIVRAIHAAQEPTIDEFAALHGMTPDAYKAAVSAHLQALTQGADISVRRSVQSLQDILTSGRMKTVHETGQSATSAGTGSADKTQQYAASRAAFEAAFFGASAQPPVYGYLALPGHDDLAARGFGAVRITLKPSVASHTTVTFGDSLQSSQHPSMAPRPMSQVQYDASVYPARPASAFGRAVTPAAWASQVDPLGRRSLSGDANNLLGYTEAQIHGGVSVSDIARVQFSSAPSASLKQQLRDANIPWSVAGAGRKKASAFS